ncbi:YjbE family putative metal transport protein [Acidocella sp. KAb 2-4]|uniref:YjbE family putative metal transport protein n=1 Tax=Acidocella sp. KAb 2-4 TaxID=2885158 RepID=UPI001D07A16A|nr:YjbE family putative metal transport protein [Acidocella sp. KAb 2-4]MCB5943914.1 YjbE family putative metal transport protein [Acidocella sp. KAb 2-4]
MDILSLLVPLAQILLIDLVLAGDNAIVIGLAVARLAPAQRRKAILAGTIGATVIRILFALVVVQLLAVIGLTLAGGVLLLWVAWKTARELKGGEAGTLSDAPVQTLRGAVWRIIVADVSMSLDNVLGVAGVARAHPVLLAVGLVLSIGLMGLAANLVARLLTRFHWLAWVGIAIIFYVALKMIWEGWHEVAHALPV